MRPNRTLLLAALAVTSAGCDFIFPEGDDDDDADPAFVADADGTVYGLDAGIDSLDVVWTTDLASAEAIPMAQSGGTLVVGTNATLHGLDTGSGEELWSAPLLDQVTSLTVGDGRAYALSFTALTAVSLADGAVDWTLDFTADGIGGVSFAPPVFAGGAVILGGDPVRRIAAASGVVMSSYATGDSEQLGLAADDSGVYVGTRFGLLGLDRTLAENWRTSTDEDVDGIVVTDDGIVYSQVGGGVAMASTDGAAVWASNDGAVYDALVGREGGVVGARLQGTVHAFDAASGEQTWSSSETSSPVRGLAVLGATVLYAGGTRVQGLDTDSGTVLWEWSPAAAPVSLTGL